jgi:hypothetical protein
VHEIRFRAPGWITGPPFIICIHISCVGDENSKDQKFVRGAAFNANCLLSMQIDSNKWDSQHYSELHEPENGDGHSE